MTSALIKNAAMQRLIALTKRISTTLSSTFDEPRPPKPRKPMDVDRIARAAESKQRFAKGRHFK